MHNAFIVVADHGHIAHGRHRTDHGRIGTQPNLDQDMIEFRLEYDRISIEMRSNPN